MKMCKRKIIKKCIVGFLIFVWALSGSLVDSQDWILFFSIHIVSMGILLFIAYLDGYMY